MQTSDFDYNLPQELIAQRPVEPRDHSRLMVVDKQKKTIEHRHFYDIVDYLQSGDLIVWNNSKVFKARLFGQLLSEDNKPLLEHGKQIEIFLIRPMENDGVWQVLARPGKHVRIGTRILFHGSFPPAGGSAVLAEEPVKGALAPASNDDFYCDVMVKEKTGEILVQFPDTPEAVRVKANKYGAVPIPPYVKDEVHELSIYQTVYAKHEGSVAAPTAGFHMTSRLIEQLKNKGIEFAEVTLHIGLGTFLPVKSERIEDHTMHSEWVEVSEEAAEKVNRAKRGGRRIIAIGTTTVRTLEGVAQLLVDSPLSRYPEPRSSGVKDLSKTSASMQTDSSSRCGGTQNDGNAQTYLHRSSKSRLKSYTGDINLFITHGFQFQIVDALITNFHLPKSTLLMLVSAFAGDREFVLECYQKAVEEKYRFYSFGDAMFIY